VDIVMELYFYEMRTDPENPNWPDRDRLVLSKGHACPALYAVLALKGYFPESDLNGLRKIDSYLEGHPDVKIPGIDAPSGSLGMGLSQGLGMAMGARYTKRSFRTYVILGDGDMEEGNTWEAVMAAGYYKMDNLVVVLDANKLQGDDFVERQMNYFPIVEKVASFGWHAIEIDGHNFEQIRDALSDAKNTKGKPTFILAHTIKGKGVSFMENNNYWHGSVKITDEEFERALQELEDKNE
jgi:transketolase